MAKGELGSPHSPQNVHGVKGWGVKPVAFGVKNTNL